MVNAYEVLGLSVGLVFTEEVLREAFREAGKKVHPDAGGEEGEFATLREAFALISSPSRRLQHWLELRGMPGELRGSIGTALMELFLEVGTVTQQAEKVIRQRELAQSALVRALLEAETQACREQVGRVISQVEKRMDEECAGFPELEHAAVVERVAVAEIARNLAFLEKWRLGLRACFSRLV
jgi:curved DNA-binding protein CbpA